MAVLGADDGLKVFPLPEDRPGEQITSAGPTGKDGVFIIHVANVGFQYVTTKGKTPHREAVAKHKGTPTGSLYWTEDLENKSESSLVSFAEASKTQANTEKWMCMRIPAIGSQSDGPAKAELVAETQLPAKLAASCSHPEDALVAIMLVSHAIRFFRLSTGKAAGKGVKIGAASPDMTTSLVRLGPGRVAAVRTRSEDSASGVEFFVVKFDEEVAACVLQISGTLQGSVPEPSWGWPKVGPFRGAVCASSDGTTDTGEDRLLLCWPQQQKQHLLFAAVCLKDEAPLPSPFPPNLQGTSPSSSNGWTFFEGARGYLLTTSSSSSSGAPDGSMRINLREARSGMSAGSFDVPLGDHSGPPKLIETTGGSMMLLGRKGTSAALIKWSLPVFSLNMVIGKASAAREARKSSSSVAVVHEVAAGKRKRDDPEFQELFSAKRRAVTDKTLAAEVLERRCVPVPGFVNLVAQQGCNMTAGALLGLPELSDDSAAQLLAAEPRLLPRVVKRIRSMSSFDEALSKHLPAAKLPGILNDILDWLEAYRNFTEDEVRKVAPAIPDVGEVIVFLTALADGCLPILTRLDGDLLDRVREALSEAQGDVTHTEQLYANVRAMCRIRKPLQGAIGNSVEVMVLSF